MTLVTPRIVNSVSCVKRIDHESHFAWQVFTNDSIGTFSPDLYILYLVKLPAPPRADLSGNMEN